MGAGRPVNLHPRAVLRDNPSGPAIFHRHFPLAANELPPPLPFTMCLVRACAREQHFMDLPLGGVDDMGIWTGRMWNRCGSHSAVAMITCMRTSSRTQLKLHATAVPMMLASPQRRVLRCQVLTPRSLGRLTPSLAPPLPSPPRHAPPSPPRPPPPPSFPHTYNHVYSSGPGSHPGSSMVCLLVHRRWPTVDTCASPTRPWPVPWVKPWPQSCSTPPSPTIGAS